jgi:hypothetical protein
MEYSNSMIFHYLMILSIDTGRGESEASAVLPPPWIKKMEFEKNTKN